jgi:hypothetical protein
MVGEVKGRRAIKINGIIEIKLNIREKLGEKGGEGA